MAEITATRVSDTSFTVSGDKTTWLEAGTSLTLYRGVDGNYQTYVDSASYNAGTGLTTVVVTDAEVTANLATIRVSEVVLSKVPLGALNSEMPANELTAEQVDGIQNTQAWDTDASPTVAGLTISGLTGVLLGWAGSVLTAVAGSGALKVFRRNSGDSAYEFATMNHADLGSDKGTTSHADIDTHVADTDIHIAQNLTDVRLTRTDANTLTLSGLDGTTKKIYVNGVFLDLSSSKTIDTDSAADYLVTESGGSVAIGSTAFSALGAGFNDYSLLYVYLTDNSDCWNFSSPTAKDYRQALIISTTAPNANGHMAASGEGLGARLVGWLCLNSSRQTTDELNVCSKFHSLPYIYRANMGSSGWLSLGTGGGAISLPAASNRYVVCPATFTIKAAGQIALNNDNAADVGPELRIYVDSVLANSGWSTAANATQYARGVNLTSRWGARYDSSVVKHVELKIFLIAGGAPQYFDGYTYIQIERIPPT